MTDGIRTTDRNVTRYRRFINEAAVRALRDVYASDYTRERQLKDLKITLDYPLKKIDYPSIVVEYQGHGVFNTGVGHEEWFDDELGIRRKWHHSRFEGTLNFSINALSTRDRDILADSLIEVLRFGRLDAQLIKFFHGIYGTPSDPVMLLFNQMMLNADEVTEGGNAATVAPWQPEDVLVYSSDLSIAAHGGFYNTIPEEQWPYVTAVRAEPYPQGEVEVVLPFDTDPDDAFSNPFVWEDFNYDGNWIAGRAVISASETLVTFFDSFSVDGVLGAPYVDYTTELDYSPGLDIPVAAGGVVFGTTGGTAPMAIPTSDADTIMAEISAFAEAMTLDLLLIGDEEVVGGTGYLLAVGRSGGADRYDVQTLPTYLSVISGQFPALVGEGDRVALRIRDGQCSVLASYAGGAWQEIDSGVDSEPVTPLHPCFDILGAGASITSLWAGYGDLPV